MKIYLHRRGIPVDLTGHFLTPPATHPRTFPLVFDGEPLCHLPRADFDFWVDELRRLKQTQENGIPQHLEVAAFRHGTGAFEGIFVFSHPGRLVRPVKHLKSGLLEWIGPLGQPWMSIACLEEEVLESHQLLEKQKSMIKMYTDRPDSVAPPHVTSFKEIIDQYKTGAEVKEEIGGVLGDSFTTKMAKNNQTAPILYTHVEISPTSMLSITSSLTPFSNHNQSPRNMYQCQMLKQTMATPFHSVPYRTDNKAYRVMFPQNPVVRTKEFRDYKYVI